MAETLVQVVIGIGSSVLSGLALSVGKTIYKEVKIKFTYVKDMRRNFADLERELQALCAIEDEQVRLIRRERKMQLTPMGESWLEEVKKIKDEFQELKIEYQTRSARKFLLGVYPASESVKLAKRIVEKTKKVVSLKSRINEITMTAAKAPTSILGKFWKLFKN